MVDLSSVIADWCYINGVTQSSEGNWCIPYEKLMEEFDVVRRDNQDIIVDLVLSRLNDYSGIIECDFEEDCICMWFYTDYLKHWNGKEED